MCGVFVCCGGMCSHTVTYPDPRSLCLSPHVHPHTRRPHASCLLCLYSFLVLPDRRSLTLAIVPTFHSIARLPACPLCPSAQSISLDAISTAAAVHIESSPSTQLFHCLPLSLNPFFSTLPLSHLVNSPIVLLSTCPHYPTYHRFPFFLLSFARPHCEFEPQWPRTTITIPIYIPATIATLAPPSCLPHPQRIRFTRLQRCRLFLLVCDPDPRSCPLVRSTVLHPCAILCPTQPRQHRVALHPRWMTATTAGRARAVSATNCESMMPASTPHEAGAVGGRVGGLAVTAQTWALFKAHTGACAPH